MRPGERIPVEQRFWAKVDQTAGVFACWNWTATTSIGGRYGAFYIEGRMRPAHQVAYELRVGPIPDGLEMDHLCRNAHCVNPAHLEPVTHQENSRRGLGPTAENARKTGCPYGHGGYRSTPWGRICSECARERNRRYRLRKKVAA